jgi:adenylosuccinate synthase
MSKNVVVVGAQWGDEGKGKIVDWLTESVQGVVRFNGGHNAGHTLVINGQKTVLRLIPSGVMHPHVKCYIGNGAVVSPEAMLKEIDDLKAHGMDAEDRIFVSGQCPLVLPYHIALDHARENALGDKKIGTTGRGIGPAYEDKIARRAVHVRDLAEPKVFAEKVRENCKLINFLLVNYYNSEPVDVEKMIEDTLAMAPRIVPKIRDISHILNTKMKEGEQFHARHRPRNLPVRHFQQYRCRLCQPRVRCRSSETELHSWHYQGLLHTCRFRPLPDRTL